MARKLIGPRLLDFTDAKVFKAHIESLLKKVRVANQSEKVPHVTLKKMKKSYIIKFLTGSRVLTEQEVDLLSEEFSVSKEVLVSGLKKRKITLITQDGKIYEHPRKEGNANLSAPRKRKTKSKNKLQLVGPATDVQEEV